MSRKIHTLNIEKILYRIGQIIGTQKKKTIAEALGTTSQGYKNWRDRNTIPWAELFEFSQKNNTSLNWLLTGKETSSQNPSITFLDASDTYLFLKSLIPRANRALREGRHPLAFARMLKKWIEAEIIDLEDALKTKENKEKEGNNDK